MPNINEYGYQNGREILENGNIVNVANQSADNTIAFEKLSISTSSVSLTIATYGDSVRAILTVEGTSIRVRTDGTAPTSSTGLLIADGDILDLTGLEISRLKMISATGSTATVNVEYKG